MTASGARSTVGHVSHTPTTAGDRAVGALPDRLFADVLCAVDGTQRGYTAVEQAAALVGPAGQLTLLAVTAVAGAGAFRSAAIDPARVERVLDRARQIAEQAGTSVAEKVDPGGPPSAVILEAAAQHDLLALGAPAMSWLGGMLVGDVAFEALESFATPLLMARPTPEGSTFARRILIATDALDGSDELVELAAGLAREQQASVILVHADGAEPARSDRLQAQDEVLRSALPDGSELIVCEGGAREAVVDIAASAQASLIVMGSRRRGGLLAFGSVSRRVVHDASCSVLLVPPE